MPETQETAAEPQCLTCERPLADGEGIPDLSIPGFFCSDGCEATYLLDDPHAAERIRAAHDPD